MKGPGKRSEKGEETSGVRVVRASGLSVCVRAYVHVCVCMCICAVRVVDDRGR